MADQTAHATAGEDKCKIPQHAQNVGRSGLVYCSLLAVIREHAGNVKLRYDRDGSQRLEAHRDEDYKRGLQVRLGSRREGDQLPLRIAAWFVAYL